MNFSIRPNKYFYILLFFIFFFGGTFLLYKKYENFRNEVIEEFTLKLAKKRVFFYRINNIKVKKKYWGYLVSYYVPFSKIGDYEYKPGLLFFKDNKPFALIPKDYYEPGKPIYFYSGLTVYPLRIYISNDLPDFYLIELNAPDLEIPNLNYTTNGIKFFILTGLEGKKPIFEDYDVDLNGFVVNEHLEPVGYSYNGNLYFEKLIENVNWNLYEEFIKPFEGPKIILYKEREKKFGPPTAYRKLYRFSLFKITHYKLPFQYIYIQARKIDPINNFGEFVFYFPNVDNISIEIINSTWPYTFINPGDNMTYISGKTIKIKKGLVLKFSKFCGRKSKPFKLILKLEKKDFLKRSCLENISNETFSFPVYFRASLYDRKINAFLSMPDTGKYFGPQGYLMKFYNLTFYKKTFCLKPILENISRNITLFNFTLPYDFEIYPEIQEKENPETYTENNSKINVENNLNILNNASTFNKAPKIENQSFKNQTTKDKNLNQSNLSINSSEIENLTNTSFQNGNNSKEFHFILPSIKVLPFEE